MCCNSLILSQATVQCFDVRLRIKLMDLFWLNPGLLDCFSSPRRYLKQHAAFVTVCPSERPAGRFQSCSGTEGAELDGSGPETASGVGSGLCV